MTKKYSKYEDRVRKELILWLQKKYPDCFISKKSIKGCLSEKRIPDKKNYLSPDIDVLIYCESSDELISFEVKAPAHTYKDQYIWRKDGEIVRRQFYKGNLGRLSPEDNIEKTPQPYKLDLEIVYKGIGEALFNLRYVDRSFLVLPDFLYLFRYHHQIFLRILLDKVLPLGFIKYNYSFSPGKEVEDEEFPKERLEIKEFTEIVKAKNSTLWQDYEKAINEEEKTELERQMIQDIRAYLMKETKSNQV